MQALVSKKQFKYKKNIVAVKVELDDEFGLKQYTVTVICATRKHKTTGILTCCKKGVDAAIKRLIRFQLINVLPY